MLFNTIEFWIFFSFVFLFTRLLPHRGQNTLLLVASYIFYAAWDYRFLALIFTSTFITYALAPFSVPSRSTSVRKLSITISIVINLGILCFFKYYDFFVQSFADLFFLSSVSRDSLFLNLILPVGISFYTFQTISYIVDVYSGKVDPSRNFFDFALYVSFFPQLVAGPIERSSNLLPQIANPRTITFSKIESGCYLIVWGLFKKVFIADAIAHPVNCVFALSDPTGPEVYFATIAFAVQIYCDFSGYSDIARGLARMLGFELMLNFNLPYLAKDPSDFWRRWHISLSTWLRDYLYIPLGGNKKGKFRTYFNLMATMALGGLWHGARYNFLLWGIFHGGILAVSRPFRNRQYNLSNFGTPLVSFIRILFTFHLVLFGWLLFRVDSMAQLRRMISGLLGSWSSWESSLAILKYCAPLLLPLVLFNFFQVSRRDLEFIIMLPYPLKAFFVGLTVFAVILLNRGQGAPFIYFQF